MILSQSAATAAVLSIEDNVTVQNVSYEKLRTKLLDDGQILELKKTDRLAYGSGVDPAKFSGLVVDGEDLAFEENGLRAHL